MLTGPRALSATDVFADAFARMHRGRIVGEPTGGSIGDPLAFALPGGGSARVSTSRLTGSTLLGNGVQPDVPVPATAADFLAGRDAALKAGIAELKTMMKK
jgi:C-terminal processing protease CtpA/Prc